jgi:hypothetical protein
MDNPGQHLHRPVQKVALFKGCQSNPNLLGILVLDAVLPMIRLATFTLEEAPLPVGIQSFTGSAEFGDEGHDVFILQCHRLEATAETHELFHLLRNGVINTLRDPNE